MYPFNRSSIFEYLRPDARFQDEKPWAVGHYSVSSLLDVSKNFVGCILQ